MEVLAVEPIGAYAIVGGVAVTVRAGSAHRSTTDVDTVVDEGVVPSALEVLLRQPGAVAGGRFHGQRCSSMVRRSSCCRSDG